MSDFAELMSEALQPFKAVRLMGDAAVVSLPQSGSRSLVEIMADKDLYARKMAALAAKLSVDKPLVAALLWQKQFVRGFLGQWLANALFGNAVAPNSRDLYLDGENLKGLQWQRGEVLTAAETADVLAELAREIAESFSAFGVHTTDSWGNIALAVADPWMKARQYVSDVEGLMMSHARFVRHLPMPLQTAMLLLPYERADGVSAVHFRRRRSCCLKYEVPNKSYCSTCSKVPLKVQLRHLSED